MMDGVSERKKRVVTPAAVWVIVREAYLQGITARVLGERYFISETTIRKRAEREGWTRAAHARALEMQAEWVAVPEPVLALPAPEQEATPEPLPEPAPAPAPRRVRTTPQPVDPDDLLAISDLTLRRAVQAQAAGQPVEAQQHVKAGLAINDFHELVEALREKKAARLDGDSARARLLRDFG